jgi:hypothetical protein
MASTKAKIVVGNVRFLYHYDTEFDEHSIKVYVNGKYQEDRTYYTDDKQDALDTMQFMAREEQRNQKKGIPS